MCDLFDIGATINININSKPAGTTMGKTSFEGVVALKRAGFVLTFQTVCSSSGEMSSGECLISSLWNLRGSLLDVKVNHRHPQRILFPLVHSVSIWNLGKWSCNEKAVTSVYGLNTKKNAYLGALVWLIKFFKFQS